MTKDEKDSLDSQNKTVEPQVVKPASAEKPASNKRILFIVAAVLLFVAASVACVDIFVRYNAAKQTFEPQSTTIFTERLTHGMLRGERNYSVTSNNTTTDSTTTVASGVVTSVGNGSFVIGGNGVTITVKTNGDTTYNTTSKKVSVADSVMITGTESNDTITATSVRIVND